MKKLIMNLIESETIKQEVTSFTENAIGAFLLDPVDLYKVIKNIWSMHSRIRDGIYWENFGAYLFHVYDFDEKKKRFINNNKKKLAEMLAEDTPNQEAGYKGNPERLRENAKRLVILLDDAGTKQKAIYYANLTRAALNNSISRDKFFKLCKCVSDLTEEDICFFIKNIQQIRTNTIKKDEEFIDDFRSVGLLKEVNGGFAYTQRAFELLKFGLKYEEENVKIPEEIPERMMVGPARLAGINDVKVDYETLAIKRRN